MGSMANAANRLGASEDSMALYSSSFAAVQTSGGRGMVLGRCEIT